MISDPNFWWGVGITILVIVGAVFGINMLDEFL